MEREDEDLALEAKKRYNKLFEGKLPPCIRLTMPTRLTVEECVRRFGRQAIDVVFEQVQEERFSLGANKTGFIANFQFIFKPNNFQHYLERAQLRRQKQQHAAVSPACSASTAPAGSDSGNNEPTEAERLEERRQVLLGCIRLVTSNPASSARHTLIGAYESGELSDLGIDWSPTASTQQESNQ